jgi:hypothetical protein
MSYLLETLTKKEEIDNLIRNTIDKVLVLRIGRASDIVCMQLDEIVSFGFFPCAIQFHLFAQSISRSIFEPVMLSRVWDAW